MVTHVAMHTLKEDFKRYLDDLGRLQYLAFVVLSLVKKELIFVVLRSFSSCSKCFQIGTRYEFTRAVEKYS